MSRMCHELLIVGPGRMPPTRSRRRRGVAQAGGRNTILTLLLGVALTATMTLSSPLVGAARSSDALAVADYAFSTANHSRPPQIVTAADVANAVATVSVNKAKLTLDINIGEVEGFPRLVLFMNEVTYRQTCVDFPVKVGQSPTVIPCPAKAIALWQELPSVLYKSRSAVAAAASSGRAVSAADITPFFIGSIFKFLKTPTFRAGQGGVVTVIVKMKFNSTLTTSHICIRFPKTEAGIPFQVACKQ